MNKSVLLVTSIVLSASSFLTSAKLHTFEGQDDRAETKVCVAAAKEGYAAARKLAGELGLRFNTIKANMTCNDLTIDRFARKYRKSADISPVAIVSVTPMKKDVIVVVSKAAKDMAASKLCLNAALGGAISDKKVMCNGKKIAHFAKKIAQDYKEVRSTL
jgi:hypothetical protein